MTKETTHYSREDFNLYNPLIAAIIAAHVYDYIYGSKAVQQLELEGVSKKNIEYIKGTRMRTNGLTFLQSEWFVELVSDKIDAEYIVGKCDQAIASKKYGTVKRRLDSGKTKEYKYVFCFETLTEDELEAFKEILDKDEYKKLERKFKNNVPIKKNIAQRMSAWAERLVLNALNY